MDFVWDVFEKVSNTAYVSAPQGYDDRGVPFRWKLSKSRYKLDREGGEVRGHVIGMFADGKQNCKEIAGELDRVFGIIIAPKTVAKYRRLWEAERGIPSFKKKTAKTLSAQGFSPFSMI
jgi:hypothetical protein